MTQVFSVHGNAKGVHSNANGFYPMEKVNI